MRIRGSGVRVQRLVDNGEPGTLKPLTYYISRFTFYEFINVEVSDI
jgi:hypothetical protein